jgi:murein DD-endopeptidase MepM/ murein hydrolase activator NlpD
MKLPHLNQLLAAAIVLVGVVVSMQLGAYWRQSELRHQLRERQIGAEIFEGAYVTGEVAGVNTDPLPVINPDPTPPAVLPAQPPVAPVRTQPVRQTVVDRFPFIVPTTGVAGHQAGTFEGHLYEMTHRGIDIWTTTRNGGALPTHKGNPVYAACNGKVVSFVPENGGITILCDEIPATYKVPKHTGVYTHYSHLGNAITKQQHHGLKRGQRVAQGQFLGYQGDLSSYFPEMRNVHLHFSVFTGISEVDPNGGALNPCLYIGGNCQRQGESFTALSNR